MRFTVAIVLAATLASPARADVDSLGEVRAQSAEVQQLDGARASLDGRRAQLERESQKLAAEIERLKAEPAGVRRDVRLGELLADSKAKTDELERVAAELRARGSSLTSARKALVAACDRALQKGLPEARRLELERLRTGQVTQLAQPAQPLDIGRASADPLDGPRELEEKADLLRDSGDKLKREVNRLATRIDDVERRRHLRERSNAVDDDWFGESASNRKSARPATLGAPGSQSARGAGDAAAVPTNGVGGTPAPGVPNSPGTSFGGGGTNSFGNDKSAESTVLRNLVDPATLDELRRADGGDDLERQVRALKRAQGELDGLARELDRRARALSTRADELKHKK
ncbi:MAG TPA: hypothetical protein VFF06_18635 [Polyangia bacterium]|nr:hypothetical protein [Polyangia bacterium]